MQECMNRLGLTVSFYISDDEWTPSEAKDINVKINIWDMDVSAYLEM